MFPRWRCSRCTINRARRMGRVRYFCWNLSRKFYNYQFLDTTCQVYTAVDVTKKVIAISFRGAHGAAQIDEIMGSEFLWVLKGPTGTFCKLALKVAPYRLENENIKINENLCITFKKNNEKGRILAISWGSFQMIPVRGLFLEWLPYMD